MYHWLHVYGPDSLACYCQTQKDNRRHFYTTDPNGENAGSAGYARQQGVVAWVFNNQVTNSVPMYRCYNSPQDLHFWTTDSGCEGAANYHLEGTVWYQYPNQIDGSVAPLQRYTQQNGDHWYVVKGNTQGAADTPYYSYEGVTGWVQTQQLNGNTPLYLWTRGTDY